MSAYGKTIQQHINEFLRDKHITLNKGAINKVRAVKKAHELKADYILTSDKKLKKADREKVKYGENYKTLADSNVLNQTDYINTKSQGKVEMTVAEKMEFMTRNATPLQKENYMNADYSFGHVVKREVAQIGLGAEIGGRGLEKTREAEKEDYFNL